jgi:O-antigen/teichoic acid export membrane protein
VEVNSQADQSMRIRARLRDRALSAGVWTLGSYGIGLLLRLFSNLILTRLLFPEAFGTVAAAMALVVGLALVSDFGVHAVIVQSVRGEEPDFLRSAWIFQIWRGIVIWSILAVICIIASTSAFRNLFPPSSIFADQNLPLITMSMGFMLVLQGAESTAISLQIRHLNYRPIVLTDMLARLLSLPITLIWAWLAPSVWALVGGTLASCVFRFVLSHSVVPGPLMSFRWRKDHFREIVRFGRWIVVSSFATFVSQQCDVIFLGVLMPASALGLYSIAKLLVNTGEGILEGLNTSLGLPLLGEIVRKNPDNLRDRYYRFRMPIDLAAGLFSGGLFAAGSFVVSFLYDPRYQSAGLMLQILALGTASYPFSIIATAFTAIGETQVTALASVLKSISLFACVAIGFFAFGALGAVGGVAFHRVVPSVIIILLANRRNWIRCWQELIIIPAFLGGLVIGKVIVLAAATLGIENIHQFFQL